MGYNKRPGTVTAYASVLAEIKNALDQNKDIYYPPTPDDPLHKVRDKLHWILACAKVFTDEEDGVYSDLRDRAKVSVDYQRQVVVVRPKSARRPSFPGGQLVSEVDDEFDMIRLLQTTDQLAVMMSFKPTDSFNVEMFANRLESIGWTIRARVDDPGDELLEIPERKEGDILSFPSSAEGWLRISAIRIVQHEEGKGGFNILKRKGYTTTP